MKLSLKQKALLQTVGLFGLAIVSAFAINLIMIYVSTEVLIRALGIGFFSWMAYLFYSVTLSRLEYNEKLKEMTEKKG